jgi:hypothetical protein
LKAGQYRLSRCTRLLRAPRPRRCRGAADGRLLGAGRRDHTHGDAWQRAAARVAQCAAHRARWGLAPARDRAEEQRHYSERDQRVFSPFATLNPHTPPTFVERVTTYENCLLVRNPR